MKMTYSSILLPLLALGGGYSAQSGSLVRLQADSPGTQQIGHVNVSGTVRAGVFAGSGSGLVEVPASSLTGQLPDSALPSFLARLNAPNSFAGPTNTFAGSVGVGTTSPQGVLDVRVSNPGGEVLDQVINAQSTIYQANFWQVVRPSLSGTLSRIDFGTPGGDPFFGQVEVFEGEGVGGTLLWQNAFAGGGWVDQWFTASNPTISVVAGQPYTIRVTSQYDPGFTGAPFIRSASDNRYPQGISSEGTMVDFAVRTFMSNAAGSYPALSVTSEGKVGIGTGTPETSLDVFGVVRAYRKEFRIDHPTDPDRRWLVHAAVESDKMRTVYDGTALLNAEGRARVMLPSWFEALNGDICYQLTCVGGYAPVYVSKEVKDGWFEIAGGKPGLKVSWLISATRHDKWARENPMEVEQLKQVQGPKKGR